MVACPNTDWRTIVALCRYGGLRCPSEVLALKWADVDWEHGRFRVHSPKTEHHPGKEIREVPLFPELRAILEEARKAAEIGTVYVVGNHLYRLAADTPTGWKNCNMRTQFSRILKHAGLKPWPRLLHAMRASRETELAKDYPIHVVASWLGNTPKIALKHYLMTTEDDFSKAMGRLVEKAVQSTVQAGAVNGSAAPSRWGSQDIANNDTTPYGERSYANYYKELPTSATPSSGGHGNRTRNPLRGTTFPVQQGRPVGVPSMFRQRKTSGKPPFRQAAVGVPSAAVRRSLQQSVQHGLPCDKHSDQSRNLTADPLGPRPGRKMCQPPTPHAAWGAYL